MIAVSEMNEPMDDVVFHVVYASGQSEWCHGMPDRARKCGGKKSHVDTYQYNHEVDFCSGCV